ncbi:hypothetical protein PAXINDRAFT_13072 [Paxillus involutus ATCC 200175]|uniref:Uncharacterized protein n=1 Tax=Paxillus involutus ATCC 200175 TaxID=664439 RepID=A0A0C9U3Y8_PAXIN|nr:hypothetical protein PAXINDRAFT_13072 [Paxillus involutus ATCC 200175]
MAGPSKKRRTTYQVYQESSDEDSVAHSCMIYISKDKWRHVAIHDPPVRLARTLSPSPITENDWEPTLNACWQFDDMDDQRTEGGSSVIVPERSAVKRYQHLDAPLTQEETLNLGRRPGDQFQYYRDVDWSTNVGPY